MLDDATVKIVVAILGSSLLTTILNRIFVVLDRRKEKDSATVVGLRALLKSEIRRRGNDYIREGYVTPDDLAELHEMWQVYHTNLYGNGFLDNMMNRVNSLPLEVQKV